METFNFPQSEWQAAKAEAKRVLVARARVRGLMPYSELIKHIPIRLEPHDFRFFEFLRQLSEGEESAGRGMLSSLVVHKNGDMQPGPGFFELAKDFGRDTSDLLACWIEELKKVHSYWEKH